MTDRKPPADSPAPNKPSTDDGPAKSGAKPKYVEQPPGETGGAKGPEPTRYGDWQHKGRVSDF